MQVLSVVFVFFFFNDTATTEIYTLSLHDALPICGKQARTVRKGADVHLQGTPGKREQGRGRPRWVARSEEHTSELQSH